MNLRDSAEHEYSYSFLDFTFDLAAGRLVRENAEIKLRPKGSLIVEVCRYDGAPLHGRVTFDLTTGPSAQAGLTTQAPSRSV